MGQYEVAYFAKHFKTIKRLEAFRKKFNTWDYSHAGKGIWYDFDGPVPWSVHQEIDTDGNAHKTITHRDGSPIKWIYLTKNKVDKEIARRKALEESNIKNNK